MSKIDYMEFDEKVERYLKKKMTADGMAEFKALLAQDNDLKERARMTALMIRTMKDVETESLAEDKQLYKTISNMTEEQFRKAAGIKPALRPAANKVPKSRKLWLVVTRWTAAACVACALVFGGYRYYGYQQTVVLGNTSYTAYVSDISSSGGVRSSSDDVEISKQLYALFDNVKNGEDISSSIEELKGLYEQAQDENSEYSVYIDDIAWNLAIAYLKDGDKESPLPILEHMLERNKNYSDITKPVQELIDKIKDL